MANDDLYDAPYGQDNQKDATIDLAKLREFVHSSKTRSAFKRMQLYPANYQTQDAYDDSQIFDMRLFASAVIHVKEVGRANAVKYKILACLDPSAWCTLYFTDPTTGASSTEQVVTAGSEDYQTLLDSWAWVKIQIKSNSAGNAGIIQAYMGSKTP